MTKKRAYNKIPINKINSDHFVKSSAQIEDIVDKITRKRCRSSYEVKAEAILLTDLYVKNTGKDFFVLVEKDCINLLHEDIIMRQWVPDNPFIIQLYFEEGNKMRLKESEVETMQGCFNYINSKG